MKNILNIAVTVFAMIAITDLIGFGAWILSGQTPPPDGYYLGALTVNFIRLFI